MLIGGIVQLNRFTPTVQHRAFSSFVDLYSQSTMKKTSTWTCLKELHVEAFGWKSWSYCVIVYPASQNIY